MHTAVMFSDLLRIVSGLNSQATVWLNLRNGTVMVIWIAKPYLSITDT